MTPGRSARAAVRVLSPLVLCVCVVYRESLGGVRGKGDRECAVGSLRDTSSRNMGVEVETITPGDGRLKVYTW